MSFSAFSVRLSVTLVCGLGLAIPTTLESLAFGWGSISWVSLLLDKKLPGLVLEPSLSCPSFWATLFPSWRSACADTMTGRDMSVKHMLSSLSRPSFAGFKGQKSGLTHQPLPSKTKKKNLLKPFVSILRFPPSSLLNIASIIQFYFTLRIRLLPMFH